MFPSDQLECVVSKLVRNNEVMLREFVLIGLVELF